MKPPEKERPAQHDRPDFTSETFLVLVGPTCVGKSEYVRELLSLYPLEVVNMDSFQVYSHFCVGTGRVNAPAARSHLYGFLEPTKSLSGLEYLELAEAAIYRIMQNGNIPLFEGGSVRFLRALSSRYRLRVVGIRPPSTEWMMQRIGQRMDPLSEARLLAEIEDALRLGYRNTRVLTDDVVYLPLVRYLDKEITLDEARDRIRANLLQMTSRQMAEYRDHQIEWFYPGPDALNHLRTLASLATAATAT